jgi:DNA primase
MSEKKVFEPVLLPLAEKERLCRELLDEFGLPVHTHYGPRHELVIPCRLGAHRNQDHDPTAALNYHKLAFKCLGCKRKGGLLWFIAEHRGSSGVEARQWLAQETGTDGETMDLSALLRFFDALYSGKSAERVPLPSYAEETLAPWALMHPWVTDPIEYDDQGRNVGGRGISEENAERFRIGYAEEYFMGRDKPTSERIIIPHFWRSGLVGWQSRRLCADGTPKYKASSDFPRDTTVFNYDPDADWALVVEAPLSTVAQDGDDLHVESTFGANVTDHQARLLARHKRVLFWFDNDHAGWEAYTGLFDWRGRQTSVGLLEQVGSMTDVWVVQNDLHADPADLTRADVRRLVDGQAVPWVLWEMPPTLRCYRCEQAAHEGGCAA